MAARWIAQEGRSNLAPQILYPGMTVQWNSGALVASRQVGRRHIFAGPPCGPKPRMLAALRTLESSGQSQAERLLWFGVTDQECDSLGISPSRKIHLGDQAVLSASMWAERPSLPSSLRSQIRRAERHGFQLLEIPLTSQGWNAAKQAHPWLFASIRDCRKRWLQRKGRVPMGFMTACLDPAHESWIGYPFRHITIASKNQKVIGYTLASAIPRSHSVLVENFVRHPKAPNGLMELLIHHVAQWALSLGCEEVNLGLAPLHVHVENSAIQASHSPNWYVRFIRFLRRFGEPFYHFRGLAKFKQRLHPIRWEPLFLVVPQDGFRPKDALAIAWTFFSRQKTGFTLKLHSGRSPSAKC